MLLILEYLDVPWWRLPWEVDSEMFNAAVSNATRRTQFENIKRLFHRSDNATLNSGDKFAKMRPLMAMLKECYLSHASLEENLCVMKVWHRILADMEPKLIQGKSVCFGFKFWCLHDGLGYLVQFEPYQSGQHDKDIGLGTSAVLVSQLPSEAPLKLFGDRIFHFLQLTDQLKVHGTRYTGVVMSNCTEHCPVM